MKRLALAAALMLAAAGALPLSASAAGGLIREGGFIFSGCLMDGDPMLAGLRRAGFTEEQSLIRCLLGASVGKAIGR